MKIELADVIKLCLSMVCEKERFSHAIRSSRHTLASLLIKMIVGSLCAAFYQAEKEKKERNQYRSSSQLPSR